MSLKNNPKQSFWERASSRKLIAFVVYLIATAIFLKLKLLDADQWVDFNQFIFLVYVSGNVSSKITDSIGKLVENKIQNTMNKAK